MFIYFHKNKFYNQKGQLVPLFIVVLVVLLIMVLVTVNLGKLAIIKTESSNASDAGVLSGGSIMAALFNNTARINSEMEFRYWRFFSEVSTEFVYALKLLMRAHRLAKKAYKLATNAEENACSKSCSAANWVEEAFNRINVAIILMNKAYSTIFAIKRAITKYHDEEYKLYKDVREMVKKGREDAIKAAHGYNFSNSGTGSKLKDRSGYSNFLSKIGSEKQYYYQWTDGQGRGHKVVSTAWTDEVKKFMLQITKLPYAMNVVKPSTPKEESESSLLEKMIKYADDAGTALQDTREIYLEAYLALDLACLYFILCVSLQLWACSFWMARCYAARELLSSGRITNELALTSMDKIKKMIPVALNGLEPQVARRMDDIGTGPVEDWIICWIEDIEHNRRFQAGTDQEHAGADLGLWQTQYPSVHSDSRVNFNSDNKGLLHPPEPKYNASIEAVDVELKTK